MHVKNNKQERSKTKKCTFSMTFLVTWWSHTVVHCVADLATASHCILRKHVTEGSIVLVGDTLSILLVGHHAVIGATFCFYTYSSIPNN